MTDLNSLVANYITKNPNMNVNEIVDKLGNLDFNLYDNFYSNRYESLFNFNDNSAATMNEDAFINLMATATGKNKNDIQEEASLLFDILDSNDDNSKNALTSDELEVFKSKDGTISHFSVWNNILVNEDEINKKIQENMNSNETTGTENADSADFSEIDSEKDLIPEIDLNGDGKITKDELDKYNKKVENSSVQDTDNSSKVEEDEDLFAKIDTNGDGKITQEEIDNYNNTFSNLFDEIDKNGDGKISQYELNNFEEP